MERTLRVSSLVSLLAVVGLAACQFPAPPDVQATDGPIDTPEIDRPPTPARLEAVQDLHDFGGVVIGGTSATFGVMVQNTGELAAGPIALSLTGAGLGEFEIVPTGDSSDCGNKALAGGETCRAQVRFKPTLDQAAAASFVIAADPGGSVAVPVTGDALTAARLTSLVSTESFGGVVLGASSTLHRITIQNDGEQSTGLLGVTKAGPNQAEFTIVAVAGSDCQGATLAQQGTCQIDVRFAPAMAGTQRTATITVAATPGGSYPITVTGDGLSPGDLTIEQPTGGATLDFGARDLGTGATSATQTIRVRNTGGVATGALVVTITGGASPSYALPLDGCSGNPLGANSTCDIAVRFNPAAIGAQPATIQIRDNASGGTQAVNATGVGTGNIAVTKTGTGAVTSAPAGISCNGACPSQTGSFSTTPVTLTATPDAGWTFDSWGGACASAGSTNVCSVAITQALTNVSATFRQLFTLTIATTGAGAVTSNPFGITCGTGGTDCSEPYLIGTNVQLTADPDPGYEVASWTGSGVSCGPAQRTCAVSMTQARTVAVEFRPLRTLTVSTVGTGVGTITGGGINCVSPGTGTCTAQVIDGTLVTLARANGTAAAGSQQVFGGWGGDCNAFGLAAACTFTMDAAKNVAATFTLQHRLSLTINSVSGAMGSLLANPGNFLCNANTCEQFFNAGTNLTITASPATGIDVLQSVSGACTTSPCSIAGLDGPKAVTATFLPSPGDLLVVLPASGSLDFGSLAIGAGATSATQTIRIRNNGGSATGALQVTITGAGASSYTTPGDACGGATLAAGATCDIAARFNPTAVGTLGAVVTVRDPLTGATRGVNVGGVGTSTVTVTKTGNGTITSTPAGIACGATCTASLQTSPLSLAAVPDAGWVFDSWSGACASAGSATTCSVNLTSATTNVGALFRPLYTLTVAPTGMGTITSAPAGITCGADCTEAYVTGTSVTLTAEPAPGWEVASWAGTGTSCGAAQHTCTTSMTLARTVAVEFRPLYTVAVTVGGTGTGTITGSGLNCASGTTGTCTVQVISGTSVTLTQAAASAGAGSQNIFGGWGGDCAAAGTATTCTLTVTAARTAASTFTRQYLLTLVVASNSGGRGSMTANPGAFTCASNTCTRYYDVGTSLTITSTPATALDVLQGVTGDCSTSPCTLAMDAPKSATASFLPTPGSLEVVLPAGGAALDFGARQVGTGGASATQTIRIRNNGGTPTGALDTTITGAGASGYTAVTDGCDGLMLGVGLTCDIAVRFNPTAVGEQAAVVTVRDTVSGGAQGVTTTGTGTGVVTVTKTGNGSIASTPAGVSCGTSCSASFAAPPVSLAATADPGWIFDSWGGACTAAGTATTCSLTLAGASTSVSATFRPLYTLTVTPSGSGSVTSAPAGITCGADCTEAYVTGTSVTLTAEPAPGYEVYAWTGTGAVCNASQRTCTVSMTQARNVNVEFRLLRTLGVTVNGSGTGTITGSGINCASGSTGTCAVQLFDGTSVTLTETPGSAAAGTRHLFTTWGGDCTTAGTATTCTFTMSAARAVTATFTRQWQLTLTVGSVNGAMGTVAATPGTFSCTSGSCTQYFDAGTTLMVTATEAPGTNDLQGVTGACTASPCSVTMDAAKTVTATFQPTPGALALDAPVSGALDFGAVAFGVTATPDQVITIRNSGGSATGALTTSLTGAYASSFALVTNACSGVTLAANATCSITVRFTPTAVGTDLPGLVSVTDPASGATRTVNVKGTGTGSVTVTKTGNGSITSVPAGLSCGTTCTTSFPAAAVRLDAVADPGWTFSTWGGACAGSATTCTLSLNAASTAVTATFVPVYTLTVATSGSGLVTSAPAGISCGADCSETYVTGTSVTLTAEPAVGYEVYAWTGTGTVCPAGQRTCTTTMTIARNVTVEFRRQFTLNVSLTGAGSGTVTATAGATINCTTPGTGTCSATVFDNTSVTLTQAAGTAAAGSLYEFTGWGGACSGTGGCTVAVTGATSVSAGYKVRHLLSLTIDSISMAQASITAVPVTMGPPTLTCTTGTCTGFYDAGVALTVTASETRAIDDLQAITGDCSGTPCSLTMNGPRSVTATVSPTPGSLSVTDPAGGGTLSFLATQIGAGGTSTPTPITIKNNGGSPTGTLTTTLSGASATSYSIVTNGCTGMALAPNGTCTVTVRFNPNAAGSQSANVAIGDGVSSVSVGLMGVGTGTLMVNKSGSGTVSSTSPIGISCGTTCMATFSSTQVDLQATPDAGYVFSGWTGACTGTATTCSVSITSASTSVTATFTQVWTMSVAVNGSGVVTSAPTGITCGNGNNDCSETYNAGTNVTLTATPDAGYDVAVWTGTGTVCPILQRTCVVPMTAARNVSVEFRPIPTVPVLAKPMNGAYVGSAIVLNSRKPKFMWRASTVAGGGAITYDLQYSDVASFASGVVTISNLATNEYTPTMDLPANSSVPRGTRLYWRVRACSASMCSAYPTRYLLNSGRSDHDFNGDGYADLVVARANKTSVYMGPGLTASVSITVTGTPRMAVGDFNGDGYMDLALGTPDDDTAGTNAGKTSIYLGGNTASLDVTADYVFFGLAVGDQRGYAVVFDDFNGDGFDDLVVGSPYYDAADIGRIDAFYGAATPDVVVDRTYIGATNWKIGFVFGSVDANGDGYADLVIRDGMGDYITTFYEYRGAASGLAATYTGGATGNLIVDGGDVNGDGYGDPYFTLDWGALGLPCLGSASGIGACPVAWQATSNGIGALGDVDRDGFDDLGAGMTGNQFLVYRGGDPLDSTVDGTYIGTGGAGASICGGGDVNGDGTADFATGAPTEGSTGKVQVFFGAQGPIDMVPNITVSGTTVGENFGSACSL